MKVSLKTDQSPDNLTNAKVFEYSLLLICVETTEQVLMKLGVDMDSKLD